MIDEVLLDRARALLAEVAVIVPHTDADGLASGAIALRERGQPAGAAVLLGRGMTPWRDPLAAGTPALLDWGVRSLEGPALIIDHHAPEAEPGPGQIVLSGYGADPETTTAALTRRVCPRNRPGWLRSGRWVISATVASRCPSVPVRRAPPSGGWCR